MAIGNRLVVIGTRSGPSPKRAPEQLTANIGNRENDLA